MERTARIKEVHALFGENFIGARELTDIASVFPITLPAIIPEIPYTLDELANYAADYILILGADKILNDKPLNLLSLRQLYGVNPEISEPCFYNQDWYISERFMKQTLEQKWYLIKKEVLADTRAKLPNDIMKMDIHFPSAILCAYTFFAFYFTRKELLWYHDFIWCNDTDHNDDRIYVGKYNDIDGVNKNGFSIHRHLGLRSCYGAINLI